MKHAQSRTLEGSFQHLVYAPRGEIEGVLLRTGDRVVQVVIDKHDADAAAAFQEIAPGQSVTVTATPAPPSPKGEGVHPVYAFDVLEAVEGGPPQKHRRAGAAYVGKVARFNHARHGEPNGVVLDTGDFIHTRPAGMASLGLRIGDKVEAEGDAQRLVDDRGWAVEATHVNGKLLK